MDRCERQALAYKAVAHLLERVETLHQEERESLVVLLMDFAKDAREHTVVYNSREEAEAAAPSLGVYLGEDEIKATAQKLQQGDLVAVKASASAFYTASAFNTIGCLLLGTVKS